MELDFAAYTHWLPNLKICKLSNSCLFIASLNTIFHWPWDILFCGDGKRSTSGEKIWWMNNFSTLFCWDAWQGERLLIKATTPLPRKKLKKQLPSISSGEVDLL
jgi:hypothetical protein